ncbi:MAG: hypothetical protein A2W05_01995, partial [Candidatus Schekmanbacteria bacterium RBG_16_38_10]
KKILFYAVLILMIASFTEVSSYLMGKFRENKVPVHKPIIQDKYQCESYLKNRDQVLGWPSPFNFGKNGDRDYSGSRIVPAFPNPVNSCISLYGDSFVWCADVSFEDTWGNILSKLINCRVSNYGVPGYGTDQSYPRFHQNVKDNSRIVIFGHLSENIMRNLNQYRDILDPVFGFNFKPRFVIDANGSLKLIPIPKFSVKELQNALKNPEGYLKYEYFLPDSKKHRIRFTFPYTISLARWLINRIPEKLTNKPEWAKFYNPEDSSQALLITTKIIESFNKEALLRNKIPVVIIIPTSYDLIYYQKNKEWVYQPLIDALHDKGIFPVNIGIGIIDYIGDESVFKLFINRFGHFNKDGNKLFAEIVYSYLKEKKCI